MNLRNVTSPSPSSALVKNTHPSVHRSTIRSGQIVGTASVSFAKEAVVHTDKGARLSQEKRRNTAVYDNTEGPGDHHAK